MIKQFQDYYKPKPRGRCDITGNIQMATLEVTRQCKKCGAIVHSVKQNAGFWNGYYTTRDSECPAGGYHEWVNITEEAWH